MYSRLVQNTDLSKLLAKTYIKYGLTNDEFIILNAYCMHEGFYTPEIDWDELSEMTHTNKIQLKKIFASLADRNKLIFDGTRIDNHELSLALQAVYDTVKTIGDRITESIYFTQGMGYNQNKHMGYVVLIPFREGVGVTRNNDDWSSVSQEMWDKEDMLKLANEIRSFAEKIDDEYVSVYNDRFKRNQMLELERENEKREEDHRKKQQRKLPKPGFVILFRDSVNRYYFSYTTTILLDQKMADIRNKHGQNNIHFVHTFETIDTSNFIHQFIRKQFSNRLIENTTSYALTDDDVRFIKEENFPPNAMKWLEG
ncbi:hypothetical protein ABEW61_25310 [Paenibacillus amylolyticus]|uniref:hypothetical protein n=1 Tax=Paenibacillus TaxID=44249 RepID=UPI000C27DF81|nr:hypothetical protein [Paenibacillus sp. GM1FR]PJN62632.1 hypothetical protein PAEAM_21950 [Paenibacillus sp. GM1FR]